MVPFSSSVFRYNHAGDTRALETITNPFAAVVLAHAEALATRGDPPTRRQLKLRVVQGLYERGWSEDDVRELFRLVHLDPCVSLAEQLGHRQQVVLAQAVSLFPGMWGIRMGKGEGDGGQSHERLFRNRRKSLGRPRSTLAAGSIA